MATLKQIKDAKRAEVVELILGMIRESVEEDAGLVDSHTIVYPIVLEDGTESAIKLAISIPTGGRDGEGYDPYEEMEAYKEKVAEDKAKAEAKAKEKAAKAARDAKLRAEKAAARAAKKAEKEALEEESIEG